MRDLNRTSEILCILMVAAILVSCSFPGKPTKGKKLAVFVEEGSGGVFVLVFQILKV